MADESGNISRRDRKIEERRSELQERVKEKSDERTVFLDGNNIETRIKATDPLPPPGARSSEPEDPAQEESEQEIHERDEQPEPADTDEVPSPPEDAPLDARTPSEPRKPAKKKRKRKYRFKPRFFIIIFALILIIVAVVNFAQRASLSTDVRLTDEGFQHASRFSECVAINGIDVSEHQGTDIKWKKAKTSGVDFVFVRAGYRDAADGSLHKDAAFDANIKGASKAGLMVGAYFYSQALTPTEAREEADYLLELVKKYDITMPLVIDFEIYPGGRLEQKIDAGELYAASFYHDIVLAFCREVEDKGYESAVYANLDMYTHYMDASLLADSATLWLARYNETADLDAKYRFWQCTDKAKIGGYDGQVDHDFWYLTPNKVYKTRGAGRKEKNRISIGNCHISFQRSVTKIKDMRAVPKLSVTYEGKAMREGADYKISFIHNTEPGRGYLVLQGIGNFKNLMMVPFETE